MIKALVLVPIQDNDGRAFGRKDWDALEQRFVQAFGGFTGGQTVSGAWADNGVIYRDKSLRYEIALESWRNVTEFLQIVDWIKVHFRQIAIYIEIAGIPDIIRE